MVHEADRPSATRSASWGSGSGGAPAVTNLPACRRFVTRSGSLLSSESISSRHEASRPWKGLLALFTIASFVETMFWGQVIGFTPLYLAALGVPPHDVAWWTGSAAVVSMALGLPFLPLWGALADRYARQPVIVRSFLAYLIAGIVAFTSQNVWIFVLGRAVMGFAFGNSGLMMTTLSERVPPGRLALAFTIMNAGSPIGAFVGPIVGGSILDAEGLGFPGLVLVDGVLLLAVIVALSVGYRDPFVPPRPQRPLLAMVIDSVRMVGASPMLPLFPGLFLLFTGWMLANTFAPIAVASLYRGTDGATAVGLVLGAGGLATLVIAPVMGAMADRLGRWRVLIVAALLETLLWPAPALAPTFHTFGIAWAVVSGVASGVFALSFSVLSGSARPDVRGRVMAFAYVPVNVGFMVGAGIGALVAPARILTIFPMTAAVTAFGAAALVLARRRLRCDAEPLTIDVADSPPR
jgi:MFS transporter, DHA1 family, multidrug resistance protein